MSLQIDGVRDSKGSVRDYVHDTLKKNIMELRLEPGRFISEKEAVELLQVSRTPIREAFVKLSQEELIETFPQKGSFISLIDMRHVEESKFVRTELETAIVRQACELLSNEQILHLNNLVSLQRLCIEENNNHRLFELDEEFHGMIMAGCGKMRTWAMLQQMNTHYNRMRYLHLLTDKFDWEHLISQHSDIVSAIRERNADEAERVMLEHMNRIELEKAELRMKYPSYFK
ncbi:GntR family transcriptional regulator [Paenibacillus allorhizosphaerae]|uniref:HTH-type transcriptional repressor RspR n=1 Tax=Paenibacillus allorhizosphaerae TaxID=2849866 RepID=A0ABM8V9Y6_9BACL|nr:GntR family transcriptional regulator [Paenibacillus allorhizosphaerae]CAG7614823.1 HTH-type transcriptional repressor RspR [Paenibacillus allorhizosphaerae]